MASTTAKVMLSSLKNPENTTSSGKRGIESHTSARNSMMLSNLPPMMAENEPRASPMNKPRLAVISAIKMSSRPPLAICAQMSRPRWSVPRMFRASGGLRMREGSDTVSSGKIIGAVIERSKIRLRRIKPAKPALSCRMANFICEKSFLRRLDCDSVT